MPADIRVVIADDHPPVLEFLSRFLSNNEITITASTRDGEEALRKIEQTRPDVAVLDARMPRLSGLEVLRRLVGSDIPTRVILYTGYGDDALLSDALGNKPTIIPPVSRRCTSSPTAAPISTRRRRLC